MFGWFIISFVGGYYSTYRLYKYIYFTHLIKHILQSAHMQLPNMCLSSVESNEGK